MELVVVAELVRRRGVVAEHVFGIEITFAHRHLLDRWIPPTAAVDIGEITAP
jgi:hypothetical protein